MHRKIILASLIALSATWAWGTHAGADQTRKSITPLLILQAQYDSNFYKDPIDEIDVWTNIARPGLEAEIETERSYASLFYTLDAHYYSGL
ncbi:MAG: hypothetical protein AMJ61_12205, partial [Desulfobacterales bacterium SG8_35_2]